MTPAFKNSSFRLTISGINYLLFIGGLLTMAWSLITQQWLIFTAVMLLPLTAIILIYAIEKPILSYVLFATATCYFSAIYRYSGIEGLSGILDIALAFCLFSISINIISNKESYSAKRGFNALTITYLIWLVYCFLILLTPYAKVTDLISSRSVFLTLPLTYFISGVLLCSTKKLRITLLLLGLFIITAVFKAYWQKRKGFDSTEMEWLLGGAWHTHILQSGIRYFSFYTDAGNYGSSMGMFTVTFGIIGIIARKKMARYACIGIAILAWIGMMMSGTRGAMIVPFGGIALYCLLSKSVKMMISSLLLGICAFSFFYFTDMGNDNIFIKRMRTAFRPSEDASFNTRVENQARFAYYLADKPFGVGVGGKIVDVKGLMELDEDYIPTDSYYVGIWVEGGVVGLCLYLALQAIVLLRSCYLLMFKIKNRQLRLILTALLCSIFGIWLNGYAGRGMGFLPSSFIIAVFFSFILNGPYMDKQLQKNEIII
ncbi:O-antigen ligase family protein [Bacteroides zoogleoformans]|uniref:O-antigen ligase family protein n=1 Tax=Bacteroides zoogleoformans TaxID=28119 RepID=UPI00248F447B|nr:O-antigen ligase family protein [Bacteroides zoogleoformans]